MRLQRGEATIAPGFHLEEALAQAPTPAFTEEGFTRPARVARVALVDGGQLSASGGTLNSARSAAQYGLQARCGRR